MTRTGREHQRRSQTCEDVPHVEVPLRGTQGVGLFCIFDGHCGRNTAKVGPVLQRDLCWRAGGSAFSSLPQEALSVAEEHLPQPGHPGCAHCSWVKLIKQGSGLGKASCLVSLCRLSSGSVGMYWLVVCCLKLITGSPQIKPKPGGLFLPRRRHERCCPRSWLPVSGESVQPCRLAGAQTPSGRRSFWPLTARSRAMRAAQPLRCWSGRTPLAASACRWASKPACPASNRGGMHQLWPFGVC